MTERFIPISQGLTDCELIKLEDRDNSKLYKPGVSIIKEGIRTVVRGQYFMPYSGDTENSLQVLTSPEFRSLGEVATGHIDTICKRCEHRGACKPALTDVSIHDAKVYDNRTLQRKMRQHNKRRSRVRRREGGGQTYKTKVLLPVIVSQMPILGYMQSDDTE